ncbi:MAG: hypothetical protein QOI30_1412, partial [Mycobacterium sp.]|nr:hypothetical protein [Mycobacterium sp.]
MNDDVYRVPFFDQQGDRIGELHFAANAAFDT